MPAPSSPHFLIDPITRVPAGEAWQDTGKTLPANVPGQTVRVMKCPATGIDLTCPAGNVLYYTDAGWTIIGSQLWTGSGSTATPMTGFWSGRLWTPGGGGFTMLVRCESGGTSFEMGHWESTWQGFFTYCVGTGAPASAPGDFPHSRVPRTVLGIANGASSKMRVDGVDTYTGTCGSDATATTPSQGGDGETRTARAGLYGRALDSSEQIAVEAWAGAEGRPDFDWRLVSFSNAATGALRVFDSAGGSLEWTVSGTVSFTPNSPDGTSGDYSISPKQADGYYYMVYTRTRNTALGGLTTFGISRSLDRLTWTNLPNVDCSGIPGLQKVWAPNWFFKSDGTKYVAFSGSNSATYDASTFKTYLIECTSLGATPTWGTPVEILGTSYIDPVIVEVDGEFFLWVKNEEDLLIEVFKSDGDEFGTYLAHYTGDWAGLGDEVEGADVKLHPQGYWQVIYDEYGTSSGLKVIYQRAGAGDWTSGGATTWSVPVPIEVSDASVLRHGGVLYDPPAAAPVVADSSTTQGAQTGGGSATVTVTASSSFAQGAQTGGGAAAVAVQASSAATQGAQTNVGAASVAVAAASSAAQGAQTGGGTATVSGGAEVDAPERWYLTVTDPTYPELVGPWTLTLR